MTLFKNKYRVQTTRLKNWDYASAGMYFVTLCTANREHFFGEVANGEVRLSIAGEVAQKFWADIPAHFNHVHLDHYVVMPNHVHGIVVLVETRHIASLPIHTSNKFGPLRPGSLSAIINAYKGSVTRWGRENGLRHFAWQPRFYDHIVRGEAELNRIRRHIQQNPAKWEIDRNHAQDLWM